MTIMYVVCVTFELNPQHFQDFRQAVQQQAFISLEEEADCHRFDVCLSIEKNMIFLYELYTDQAAFDGHLATTHFLDFDDRTRPWVIHKEVRTWQLLEQCA